MASDPHRIHSACQSSTVRRPEEPDSTVPASSRALIAAGQAEPDKSCVDREDDGCSSAGSESCWGEMEDTGDDEVVEGCIASLPPHRFRIEPEFLQDGNLRTGTLLDSSASGFLCTEEGGSGDGDDVSKKGAVQPRVSHLGPPNDNTGAASGEAVPFCGSSHRRLRLVGIDRPVSEAPSMEISSLLPPTVPVPSRAVSKRSNGARNVVPRVAGVEFVADSTLVDPESGERTLESAVHAARSVSEDSRNLWTPPDLEDGAVLQGDPRRMSQCPKVAAESGEIGMAHVSPRVSTSVVSWRGVAQKASMVHAAVSSNRFSALVDGEAEVHLDSGSETVSMGDVEQVRG